MISHRYSRHGRSQCNQGRTKRFSMGQPLYKTRMFRWGSYIHTRSRDRKGHATAPEEQTSKCTMFYDIYTITVGFGGFGYVRSVQRYTSPHVEIRTMDQSRVIYLTGDKSFVFLRFTECRAHDVPISGSTETPAFLRELPTKSPRTTDPDTYTAPLTGYLLRVSSNPRLRNP